MKLSLMVMIVTTLSVVHDCDVVSIEAYVMDVMYGSMVARESLVLSEQGVSKVVIVIVSKAVIVSMVPVDATLLYSLGVRMPYTTVSSVVSVIVATAPEVVPDDGSIVNFDCRC